MLKKISLLICSFLMTFNFAACGGGGTSKTEIPTDAITLSAIGSGTTDAGDLDITIPLALFGTSEADLTGATVKVYLNGNVRNASISPVDEDLYDADTQTVGFALTNSDIADGSALYLVITKADDSSEAYAGLARSSGSTTAESTTELFSSNAVIKTALNICSKLSSCQSTLSYSLDDDDCAAKLFANDQLDNDFGLSESGLTIQQMAYNLAAGGYTADDTATTTCSTDISNLTCDDVSSGYPGEDGNGDPDTTNFNELENFMPDSANSCPGMLISS